MPFTGMHEKAQNQAEGISNRQLEEQTSITIQALEELTADAAKTARSAVLLTLQATKLAADTIKLTLKIFKHVTSFLKQAAAKTRLGKTLKRFRVRIYSGCQGEKLKTAIGEKSYERKNYEPGWFAVLVDSCRMRRGKLD